MGWDGWMGWDISQTTRNARATGRAKKRKSKSQLSVQKCLKFQLHLKYESKTHQQAGGVKFIRRKSYI